MESVDTKPAGLKFNRTFTSEDVDVFDMFKWEKRKAEIKGGDGTVLFSQEILAPVHWSDQSVQIVASKYLYGDQTKGNNPSKGGREDSIKRLVWRVANTISMWGKKDGYFDSETSEIFKQELLYILINQMAAFNSPVWFNLGLYEEYGITQPDKTKALWRWSEELGEAVEADPYEYGQAAACFLLDVEDSIDDIWRVMAESARLFKYGSGVGADWSKVRSSREGLTGGGSASGPLSFMKVQDTTGGTIKSGGKTRRSAILQTLKVHHPDIREFVDAKANEERKAWALIEEGYDGSFNGEAYGTVAFQNTNQSVRVTDEFMQAVIDKRNFNLIAKDGTVLDSISADDLMQRISENAWLCGDPGIQYHDIINKWNPVPLSGEINQANPCTEFNYLGNTACNLASLNLKKFRDSENNVIDVVNIENVSRILITAQDILIDRSGYPSKKIAEMSHQHRPLGLGFANLGGLLMSMGVPYDSDEGRAIAGCIMAIIDGSARHQSAINAGVKGPFDAYELNRTEFLDVMSMHAGGIYDELYTKAPDYLRSFAETKLQDACDIGLTNGYRNGQSTNVAPTGCLTENNYVLSSDGLLPINTMGVADGDQWQDTDRLIAQESGSSVSNKFYVNGEDNCHRISSTLGHTIEGTSKHKIRVVNKEGDYVWKQLKNVTSSDHIVLRLGGHEQLLGGKEYVSLETDDERNPTILDESFAEFLGFYMGNGYVKSNAGIKLIINSNRPDVQLKFKEYWDKYGVSFEREEHKNGEGCFSATAYRYSLEELFKVNGFSKPKGNKGEGAAGAFIPTKILQSKTSVLCAFLRGLFEADGTVYTPKSNIRVEFCTVSEKLATEVHVALESIGIAARRAIYTDRASAYGNRPLHRVDLKSNGDVAIYRDKIGFMSYDKSSILDEWMDGHDVSLMRNVTQQELITDFHSTSEGLSRDVRADISVRKYQGKFSWEWAKYKIVKHPQLSSSKIAKIQQLGNVYLVPVAAVDDIGPKYTWDISVPDQNTYIANGFISHNTISFMMGCDTTGIEPCLGLITYKLLAGSKDSTIKVVNHTVEEALISLGYDEDTILGILDFISEAGSLEGCDLILPEHNDVFATSFGTHNTIEPMGHVKMLAAVQPFLSGSSSKTCNVPESATPEDIKDIYIKAWQMGIKAVAVYRENSKRSQPVSVKEGGNTRNSELIGVTREPVLNGSDAFTALQDLDTTGMSGDGFKDFVPHNEEVEPEVVYRPVRKKLPDDRESLTHKFTVGGHEGYIHVGLYPDTGLPGEIFITMSKQGSTISGMMDAFATAVSLALQWGAPLESLCEKFKYTRFEPAGFNTNVRIQRASTSIVDYIFEYLGTLEFGSKIDMTPLEDIMLEYNNTQAALPTITNDNTEVSTSVVYTITDAPPCGNCGTLTQRAGSCYSCPSCGNSTGCG